MRTEERVVTTTVYRSETHPELWTEGPVYGEALAWLDANPIAYEIVSTKKSTTFGRGSSTYLGCYQTGSDRVSLVHRISVLRHYALEEPEDTLHGWRARFTLRHYKDKGFRGGFFQQWDGRYSRGCLDLDYTPETFKKVLARFRAWCDTGCVFPTRRILVDGETVFEDPKLEEDVAAFRKQFGKKKGRRR